MDAPRESWAARSSSPVRAWMIVALTACSAETGDTHTASTVEPPRTADTSYEPVLPDPAYSEGQGPMVCVDETHNNFHTSVGTYLPFAEVLRRDGYEVRRFTEGGRAALDACDIFVIADAQPPERAGEAPTFSAEDVELLAMLSWAPEHYYEFEDDTPRVDVTGRSQGGVLDRGAGRVAIFGEAAMFTAQVFDQGRPRVGMNAPEAPHNLRLLLNVMHWLSRLGEGASGS